MKQRMLDALNAQINAETYSAYIYFSMSAYLKSINLDGFASWMEAQAMEELAHTKKFYDYVHQRGGRIRLAAIDAPQFSWDSPLNVFEEALAHEAYITGRINELVEIAQEEKDHATQIFLQWFVTEQVEEEESVGGVVNQLRQVDGIAGGLFMLDREMGQRSVADTDTEGTEG
ncbi:MAG: ferritin [Deltaproteobacteria bacterium]|nr:MAG: ferritin [Deltaproteobacteria bacterium]